MTHHTTVAIIVAAGLGTRAGDGLPKPYRPLPDSPQPPQPMLARTASLFLDHPAIDSVLIVIHPDHHALYETAMGDFLTHPKLCATVFGGNTRAESVQNGLSALADAPPAPPAYVFIHDAARPYMPPALIDRCQTALGSAAGAIPVCAVTDTIKRVADGRITESLDRAELVAAQTPQAFHYAAICDAYRTLPPAVAAHITDDAGVAEHAGLQLAIVAGAAKNIKLTHARDFAPPASHSETHIGFGYDAHRFGDSPAQQIMLAGVAVAHDRPLLGHSDADLALHALTDAILGALGAGDIGERFPPSDPANKDRPSRDFLTDATRLTQERRGRIVHLDLTLICEAPKIAPYRDAMRAAIAEITALRPAQISVKATTTEGMGFTGRGEGIAAQAVATLQLPSDS